MNKVGNINKVGNLRNSKGYTIQELIILCAILAVFFAISLTKISFAYQDATDINELALEQTNIIKMASKIYVKAHTTDLKKDAENYIYGKDLINEGYLIDNDDFDYSNTKIKITYQDDKKDYLIEVEE